MMDEKMARIIEMLEDAQAQAEMVAEDIQNMIDDIENCETAEELQEKLYELQEHRYNAEWIADYIEHAENENDTELDEMVEAEQEAEEEDEEEAEAEEEEANEDEDEEDEDQPRLDPYTEDPLEEVTRICKDEPAPYRKMVSDYDTEVVPMGDHYDVIVRKTGEIVEQIW